MDTRLKLVPVLALFGIGASFAQGTSSPPKQAASSQKGSQKMMAMDPKMHEQMMNDLKRMETEIGQLQKTVAEERKSSIDPAHHAEMMKQQKVSDEQIESLKKTIEGLRKQLESVPQYLPQENKNKS